MAQFKRDRKIIFLSPLTSIQTFSEIRSHESHRKGRDFASLLRNSSPEDWPTGYTHPIKWETLNIKRTIVTTTLPLWGRLLKLPANSLFISLKCIQIFVCFYAAVRSLCLSQEKHRSVQEWVLKPGDELALCHFRLPHLQSQRFWTCFWLDSWNKVCGWHNIISPVALRHKVNQWTHDWRMSEAPSVIKMLVAKKWLNETTEVMWPWCRSFIA